VKRGISVYVPFGSYRAVFITIALCWSSVYNFLPNMGYAFRRTGSEHRPWQTSGAEGRSSCRGSCSRDPKKRMLRTD
jgi:hypothetical protein